MRLIDYSRLYQEKNQRIINLNDAPKEGQPALDHSYYLKYRLQPDQLKDIQSFLENNDPKKLRPHLETSKSDEATIDGISELTRENYEKELGKKAFTVIEVYSKKCPGCKQIDPLIP